MHKGQKLSITIGNEHDDLSSFIRDLAEIKAKYGPDLSVIGQRRADQLDRRAIEQMKADFLPGKGGRPAEKPLDGAEVDTVKAVLDAQSQPALARRLDISVDTVRRVLRGESPSGKTRRKIRKFLETRRKPQKINTPQKPQ